MYKVILNGNINSPVFWGTLQECRTWLIAKARIFASTDQLLYEKYIHGIVDDGELNTDNPSRNFKILNHN